MLCWVAIAPLFVALQRARVPNTLQVSEGVKLYPASPGQAFLLAYVCGILWYAGTCYWIYNTMRQYGGVSAPLGVVILILFSLYLALYHGAFGLLISLLTGGTSFSRRALLLGPVIWVGVELARTRITGFPWDLLGITQVDNIPLARIATITGVYGLSFEITVVNVAVAAAFLVRREKRKPLLLAALGAALVLQSGRWVPAPPFPADHLARLVQENIPVLENSGWTKEYFEGTLRDLTWISLHPTSLSAAGGKHPNALHPDLIGWPETPAPVYTRDPALPEAVRNAARQARTWVVMRSPGGR